MANTIALRKAYSTMLDEVYKLASLTAVLDGPNDLVKEGANANEILIPKLSMQGLANYNKQTDDKKRAIARKRTWSVIPDTSGDGTDALIYSGSFAAASEITKGYVTLDDKMETCTFTEGAIPSE